MREVSDEGESHEMGDPATHRAYQTHTTLVSDGDTLSFSEFVIVALALAPFNRRKSSGEQTEETSCALTPSPAHAPSSTKFSSAPAPNRIACEFFGIVSRIFKNISRNFEE